MKINRDEIVLLRTRLREEIMERECLLAAVELFEKYAASGHAPSSINLGGLVSMLVPGRTTIELKELPAPPPPPAPAALPPVPRVERYVHPELRALQYNGSNSKYVRWAIARLDHDYTSRDIAALLEGEGHLMTSAEISVVLSRFKRRGEIEEIRPGTGRTPAVFRGFMGDTAGEEAADAPVAAFAA